METSSNHSTNTLEQHLRLAPTPAQPLLRALIQAQARHQLFTPGQQVVVAVSGGADSLCLLHALHQLAPHWQMSLHVAHVDHRLRPTSTDDAEFVEKIAKRLGLPFHCMSICFRTLVDAPGGIEAAARSARYGFLREVATQLSAPVAVATGHHQDDQAETLLLHLVQGSGLQGLGGMKWVGTLPDVEEPPVRLVRPLLGVNRAAIHAYLHSYGLPWREDSTNVDVSHPRNYLRHVVLPQLAMLNPNIHATLARAADILAAEADHADQRDRVAFAATLVEHTPSTRIVLDWFQLKEYDRATQRGVLRHALLALGIDLRRIGLGGIDALLDQGRAITASGPHPLVAGWAWTLIKTNVHHHLALHCADVLPTPVAHPHCDMPLPTLLAIPSQGVLVQGGWQLHSDLLTPEELPTEWRSREQHWRFFGDAAACDNLFLTTFQPGMTVAPLGMMGHTRALGDIFTDHKIPPYLRPGWPVVVHGDGTVVWLCGLMVAETIRIQPTTSQVRRLEWQAINGGAT